jgi:PAS domain S-box-containing protein
MSHVAAPDRTAAGCDTGPQVARDALSPSTPSNLTTEQPRRGGQLAVELLLEAGAVLASSLDLQTTITQIVQLIVPRLADLCVIDLLDEDGSIRKVAAAARDERIALDLESLRARHPVDPLGKHPVALVIASGEPQLLSEMSGELLEGIAQSSEHARFMIERSYRSAVVAPLRARGRTLGALSLLRLGPDSVPYTEQDLELGHELARRAALAADNARLFSDLRSVEQRLEAILADLAEAITVVDPQGRTVFANRAAAALLGFDSVEDVVDAEPGSIAARFHMLDEHGHELSLDDMPSRRLFHGEAPGPLLVRSVVRATREERWLVVRASSLLDPDTGEMLYAVNVLEDITGVKRTQLNESFMAEASRELASSSDYERSLQRVAQLAATQVADWCAIDVITESGELERIAMHHRDPDMLRIAAQLNTARRPALRDMPGIREVISTGRAQLLSDLDPRAIARDAPEDEHLRLLAQIGAGSAITVPLAAPSRTLGALSLVSSRSERRLTGQDLGLAVRLGRRTGTAVEASRLNKERARIARTLEAALLPESLPEIPGVRLAAHYQAAGELNDVGGDFYDVFAIGENRWMLAIGDVCGKGPRAAGVTALARHTLRAAAILGQPPAGMLAAVHTALREQPIGADMCTIALVSLERRNEGARLTVALAGHPPPLIVAADGTHRRIGSPGTLLGVIDPIRVNAVQEDLRPDETLLLYTDGLIETGASDKQLGERFVLGTLRANAAEPALELLLERLAESASEGEGRTHRDDIALLAARVAGDRGRG